MTGTNAFPWRLRQVAIQYTVARSHNPCTRDGFVLRASVRPNVGLTPSQYIDALVNREYSAYMMKTSEESQLSRTRVPQLETQASSMRRSHNLTKRQGYVGTEVEHIGKGSRRVCTDITSSRLVQGPGIMQPCHME